MVLGRQMTTFTMGLGVSIRDLRVNRAGRLPGGACIGERWRAYKRKRVTRGARRPPRRRGWRRVKVTPAEEWPTDTVSGNALHPRLLSFLLPPSASSTVPIRPSKESRIRMLRYASKETLLFIVENFRASGYDTNGQFSTLFNPLKITNLSAEFFARGKRESSYLFGSGVWVPWKVRRCDSLATGLFKCVTLNIVSPFVVYTPFERRFTRNGAVLETGTIYGWVRSNEDRGIGWRSLQGFGNYFRIQFSLKLYVRLRTLNATFQLSNIYETI